MQTLTDNKITIQLSPEALSVIHTALAFYALDLEDSVLRTVTSEDAAEYALINLARFELANSQKRGTR